MRIVPMRKKLMEELASARDAIENFLDKGKV